MREYKKVVKRNIEAAKGQIRRRILVPKYDKFKEWLKKGAGLHDHQVKLKRDKTTYKISTCIAILPDYN